MDDSDIADEASVHAVELEVGLQPVAEEGVTNVELSGNARARGDHLHTPHYPLVARKQCVLTHTQTHQ